MQHHVSVVDSISGCGFFARFCFGFVVGVGRSGSTIGVAFFVGARGPSSKRKQIPAIEISAMRVDVSERNHAVAGVTPASGQRTGDGLKPKGALDVSRPSAESKKARAFPTC